MDALAVWDVNEGSWWSPLRNARSAWLREHGVPVDFAWRTEFYLIDAPFVRIFSYHADEDGKRYCDHDHSPQDYCRPCKLPPYDLLLNELPPAELLGIL